MSGEDENDWTAFAWTPECPWCGADADDSPNEIPWEPSSDSVVIDCAECGGSIVVERKISIEYRAMKNPFDTSGAR